MARKRGGLAGIWDRNKKVIKPLASGLAGLIGTPALGAAVGAAMGGLDREGKRGIGFDAKRGLKGGIAGYSAGSIGNSLGNALAKRGLDLGMNNALARANRGGGRLANAFLGKGMPPVAPPVAPPEILPMDQVAINAPMPTWQAQMMPVEELGIPSLGTPPVPRAPVPGSQVGVRPAPRPFGGYTPQPHGAMPSLAGNPAPVAPASTSVSVPRPAPPPTIGPLGIGTELGGSAPGVPLWESAANTPGLPAKLPLQGGVRMPSANLTQGLPAGARGASMPVGQMLDDVDPGKLGKFWNAIKPTAGKDGGNLGMWEKGLGVAGDILTGKSAAEADAARSSTRLEEARAAQIEWELEQDRRRQASLERLREILRASMPDFGYTPPPWSTK